MIGIPYIQSLFTSILNHSKVINGRFYTCPFWGSELNKLNIDEIVEFAVPKSGTDAKYPCAILLPFRTYGKFQYSGADVEGSGYIARELQMLFICNAYTTGYNAVTSPNIVTGKTTHTIPETWHDMERCAMDFSRVLFKVIEENNLYRQLYISENKVMEVIQVTSRADDQLTGVWLKFPLNIFPGCDIEDYPDTYLTDIMVPDLVDTHPLHTNI
jgi:hypothetical protein